MKRYVLSENGCKNQDSEFCSCRPPCAAGPCFVEGCNLEAQALVRGSSVFKLGEKVMLLEDGVLDISGEECDIWVCTTHAYQEESEEIQ